MKGDTAIGYINAFPRSQNVLRAAGHGAAMRDPKMTNYWCAVLLAEVAFSDDFLVDQGGVDFDTMTGAEIIKKLDGWLYLPAEVRMKEKPQPDHGYVMRAVKSNPESDEMSIKTLKHGRERKFKAGGGISPYSERKALQNDAAARWLKQFEEKAEKPKPKRRKP